MPNGTESHEGLDLGAAVSRLFGGYVAGPFWLSECVRRGQLLTPLLRLSPGLEVERQVGFDDNLPQQAALLRLISAAESDVLGIRRWTIRSRRSELTLPPKYWQLFATVASRKP